MLWQKPKPAGPPVQYHFPGLEQWQDRNLYLLETLNANVTRTYKKLGRILNSHAPVLLRAESGAGKAVLAQALHYAGQMKPRTLLEAHGAAVSEKQLAQAFAHALHEMKKAAPTNGKHVRPPNTPSSVTVLLKNVAASSPALQLWLVRLLRGELENEAALATRVRLLATTTEDLAPLAAQGRFRQDLYYRLSTYELTLPPLRERKEDLPQFVAHFFSQSARRNAEREFGCGANALAVLQAHSWPGNIRELEETLARACEAHRGRTAMIEQLELMPAPSPPGSAAPTKNSSRERFETESAFEISTA